MKAWLDPSCILDLGHHNDQAQVYEKKLLKTEAEFKAHHHAESLAANAPGYDVPRLATVRFMNLVN
jgi:hypothetical protein